MCCGAFAWTVHMAGALMRPRGPEERAVGAASRAVCDYLAGLRRRVRGLNTLYARSMAAAAERRPLPADALARARQLGDLGTEPPQAPHFCAL